MFSLPSQECLKPTKVATDKKTQGQFIFRVKCRLRTKMRLWKVGPFDNKSRLVCVQEVERGERAPGDGLLGPGVCFATAVS